MHGLKHLILFLVFSWSATSFAQFYQTTDADVKFFSSAPVEDIEAESTAGISVINVENGTISFKVKMRSFQFEKALMQEHFNENYVESERFPEATFKGQFQKRIELNTTAPQSHIIEGEFTVHGVSKNREIPVVLTLTENKKTIDLEASFEVACKDHKIKIPRILWKNIAEIIEVSVNANFQIISDE